MELTILTGAALACALGGIAPWINAEVVVVGASASLPPSAWPVLLTLCAAAQMTSKAAIYCVARWAPHRLPRRAQRVLERTRRYRDRKGPLALAVASGALFGLPPLYLVTLASGVLRMPFPLFVSVGLAGTTARYAALAWLTSFLWSS